MKNIFKGVEEYGTYVVCPCCHARIYEYDDGCGCTWEDMKI